MKRLVVLLASAFAIATAVAHPVVEPESLNFNYSVTNSDGVGLIRAFDDGQKTVLQFLDLDRSHPTIVRLDGTPVAYKRLGDYAVLPTIYTSLRVYVDDQIADVRSYGGEVDPRANELREYNSETAQAATRPVSPQPYSEAYIPGPRSADDEAYVTGTGSHSVAPALDRAPYPHYYPNGTNPLPVTERTPAAYSTTADRASAAVMVRDAKPVTYTPVAAKALVTAPPAPAKVAPTVSEPSWRAPAGSTLRSVLKLWCARAGWQAPVWQSPKLDAIDYPIPNDITLQGTFEHVITALMKPYGSAATPIRADLYVAQHQIQISEKN